MHYVFWHCIMSFNSWLLQWFAHHVHYPRLHGTFPLISKLRRACDYRSLMKALARMGLWSGMCQVWSLVSKGIPFHKKKISEYPARSHACEFWLGHKIDQSWWRKLVGRMVVPRWLLDLIVKKWLLIFDHIKNRQCITYIYLGSRMGVSFSSTVISLE